MFTAGKNSWSCAQFILLNEYSHCAQVLQSRCNSRGPGPECTHKPCPWLGLPSGLGHPALGLSCVVGGPVLSHVAQIWSLVWLGVWRVTLLGGKTISVPSPALLALLGHCGMVSCCVIWKVSFGRLTFLHEGIPVLLLPNWESHWCDWVLLTWSLSAELGKHGYGVQNIVTFWNGNTKGRYTPNWLELIGKEMRWRRVIKLKKRMESGRGVSVGVKAN